MTEAVAPARSWHEIRESGSVLGMRILLYVSTTFGRAPVPALLRPIEGLAPLGRETATKDEEIRGRLEMLLGVDDSLGRLLAARSRREPAWQNAL